MLARKGGDFCCLSTVVSPWCEAMEGLLKEAGIRCLTREGRSVLYSVAFGQNHAELELFVPWEDLEQAASLQKSLLTSELVEEAPPDSPDEPS